MAKNVALIIAGGVGSRMGSEIPKQFINVNDKPVIIYTLEQFQKHVMIDHIVVVCLDGWESILSAYCKQYKITKLDAIVRNGSTGMESLQNGINYVYNKFPDSTIVIHDGVRPMVDEELISDVIIKSHENQYGNAASTTPINEQIFTLDEKNLDSNIAYNYIPRESLVKMVTPQAYRTKNIYELFSKAFENNEGIGPGTYANTLAVHYGQCISCSAGSEMNVKLTTKENLDMFKMYLKMKD